MKPKTIRSMSKTQFIDYTLNMKTSLKLLSLVLLPVLFLTVSYFLGALRLQTGIGSNLPSFTTELHLLGMLVFSFFTAALALQFFFAKEQVFLVALRGLALIVAWFYFRTEIQTLEQFSMALFLAFPSFLLLSLSILKIHSKKEVLYPLAVELFLYSVLIQDVFSPMKTFYYYQANSGYFYIGIALIQSLRVFLMISPIHKQWVWGLGTAIVALFIFRSLDFQTLSDHPWTWMEPHLQLGIVLAGFALLVPVTYGIKKWAP